MNNANQIIEQQKDIAKEVLYKLQACDPHCILAGGAPRNWFFGKQANDLDFYVYLDEVKGATELRFERIGLSLNRLGYSTEKEFTYSAMEHLFRVYEGEYKGQKIQVMCMREKTFTSVVPNFGVSICKFWWNGGKVKADNSALISIIESKLFVADDYSAKELHVSKMMKYFPDYSVLPCEKYEEYEVLYGQKLANAKPKDRNQFWGFNTLLEDRALEVINESK